jgi:hypothetical protein
MTGFGRIPVELVDRVSFAWVSFLFNGFEFFFLPPVAGVAWQVQGLTGH